MTPAVDAARRAGIRFELHEYSGVEHGGDGYAPAVAEELRIEPARLFKTLVVSVDDELRVFVVPANARLDLRRLGKRAVLADRAKVERATGYVAGGISPLGQRRPLPTTVDESALGFDTILVSAGRRGLQLEVAPTDLIRTLAATTRALAI